MSVIDEPKGDLLGRKWRRRVLREGGNKKRKTRGGEVSKLGLPFSKHGKGVLTPRGAGGRRKREGPIQTCLSRTRKKSPNRLKKNLRLKLPKGGERVIH